MLVNRVIICINGEMCYYGGSNYDVKGDSVNVYF